jgi:MFS family permease
MSASDALVRAGAPSLLARERIVAGRGFNRWLVPPAALAIHLCIGMSYGLSVFWIPLQRAVGIDKPVACPDMSLLGALFTTTCDWRQTDLVIIFTIGIVVLGISAALFGGWLEREGPRKAGVVAALCWGGGFLISALGVYVHQLWLLWLGTGLIGGIGLGLGYISPVSTLVKWFPDRRGMATGMAIMGFGGGAMIGSPLAARLMNGGEILPKIGSFPSADWHSYAITGFKTATSVGVWQTMATMGIVYFIYMTAGAFGYRVSPAGWSPDGWTPDVRTRRLVTGGNVHLDNAHKTPQFWLIWGVLFLNVSAGIGVLAVASPMLQEIFGGSLIGQPDVGFGALTPDQLKSTQLVGAAFLGILSLFNIGGRFFWASLSDKIGRKLTYFCFFGIGMVLYALTPNFADLGSKALFVLAFCIILSMYGGGFSTVPAYLADVFGPQYVGAIHGRLLTAWSAAGVVGPLLVSYIHDASIAAGLKGAQIYDRTLYILAGFLVLGFICNALVRPVANRWFLREGEAATGEGPVVARGGSYGVGKGGFDLLALLAWAAVGIPILWGVWITLSGAVRLFG